MGCVVRVEYGVCDECGVGFGIAWVYATEQGIVDACKCLPTSSSVFLFVFVSSILPYIEYSCIVCYVCICKQI